MIPNISPIPITNLTPVMPVGTTDLDAGEAIRDTVGNQARFVVNGPHCWYGFDGTEGRWRPIAKEEMHAVAVAIGKTSTRNIANAVRAAEALTELQGKIEDFDQDPYLFNAGNGTINLDPQPETHEIEPGVFHTFPPDWAWERRPHDPDDLITQVAGCDFDGHATAPRWDSFLERIQPDPEIRDWLQRLVGYALAGNQTEAIFPVLWGKGANGKSTFVDILGELFGSYGCVAEKSLFKTVRQDGHPTDRAVLINKRLARSEELPDVELDEPKIKGLTGGDKVSGRHMREDFKEWEPTHTFLVHSNTRPRLSGTDDGIWRRVVLVPFTVQIPVEEMDPYLRAKLRQELSGILNWALRGWENYQERRLDRPAVLQEAVDEYRAESDTVSAFVERYVSDPDGFVWGLIRDHEDYAKEQGLDRDEQTRNYKAVCAALADIGGKSKMKHNPMTQRPGRGWAGISLREQ
jgi:putative DNA primase/helicase